MRFVDDFSWRAVASQHSVLMPGFAGHINFIPGCKSSILWRNFLDAIIASDSEPDIFVSDEAGHEQRMLARYRSPRKYRQIVGYEWIQTLIALEKIGYFYTLPYSTFNFTIYPRLNVNYS